MDEGKPVLHRRLFRSVRREHLLRNRGIFCSLQALHVLAPVDGVKGGKGSPIGIGQHGPYVTIARLTNEISFEDHNQCVAAFETLERETRYESGRSPEIYVEAAMIDPGVFKFRASKQAVDLLGCRGGDEADVIGVIDRWVRLVTNEGSAVNLERLVAKREIRRIDVKRAGSQFARLIRCSRECHRIIISRCHGGSHSETKL
jgi:hypothetical protein